MNVINYLLFVVIGTILAIISVTMYQYYVRGVPPADNFVNASFAVLGGELLAMAGIAISDNLKKGNDEGSEG